MKTSEESSLEVLKELLPLLEAQEDYGNDALYQTLTDYVARKECKNGYVMWPVRTAVSGKQMTPAGATEKKSHLRESEKELKNYRMPEIKISSKQQEAITSTSGPMQVLAGPGSGKTFTITQRIRYLITNCGVDPSRILVITFTRAAAGP